MLVIVVDLGCCEHQGERSIEPLLERFRPDLYFGFDVYPDFVDEVRVVDGIPCVFSRCAAWTYNGHVSLNVDSIKTAVGTGGKDVVRCFDFSAWLRALPAVPIVVKFDVEGAEYPIIEKLHADFTDLLLESLLIEWHGPPLQLPLRCRVELW